LQTTIFSASLLGKFEVSMDKRVAVVTGAAGGMGRAIVAQLLADGLAVWGLDIDAGGAGAAGDRDGAGVHARSRSI
jgi:NAD(P)-dependent dehydrogenase (short-subunit alcohol dehydrogenase family)